jgi:hypothetical protein
LLSTVDPGRVARDVHEAGLTGRPAHGRSPVPRDGDLVPLDARHQVRVHRVDLQKRECRTDAVFLSAEGVSERAIHEYGRPASAAQHVC